MRQIRIAALVLAALAALAVLGVAVALLLINPNDYRPAIVRIAQAQTGRPLRIGGPLELRVFPRLAISIADVALGNPPGFGGEPFLTVRQASVGVKLWPLLGKRLEVSRVVVDGLTANLVSRSEKDNNWRDLAQSKHAAPDSPGGSSTQTSIEGVDIRNAGLVYRDEAHRSVISLANLEIHTGRIGASDSQLTLSDLVLHGDWFADSPQGARPLSVAIHSASVELDKKSQTLAPATFDLQVGGLAVQLSAAGKNLFTDRVITGKIAVPQASARKALEALGVTVPATRDPRALAAFSCSSDYVLTVKQLHLSNLQITLDDTHVKGRAAVDDLQTMALSYDLNVDTLNMDRYLAPKAATPAPAPARSPQPPTPLPLEVLRKLDIVGTLQVGTLTFGGLVGTAVTLPLSASDGRVHLGPTQARLLGGVYNGDVVLDARAAQAHLSLNEHAKGLNVGALMKASLDTTRISGHGDANAVVTGTGNTDTDILRSLAGKIDVNVKAGAIEGVDLWYELRRARAVLKGNSPPARSGPERTLFNTFAGSGTLVKGVLSNDDLSIETDYLKVHGRGTLDLSAKTIDYSLVAQLDQLPPEGAGSELTDLKAVDIPFTLRGSLQHMAVRPDIEALAKARVRQEVNRRKAAARDELKKKLGDKLQGLFGH